MKRALRWAAIALALLVAALVAASFAVSRPLHDATLDPKALESVAIAPAAEALSFARTRVEGRPHVLLVSQWRDGRVTGVDLNERLGTDQDDPLALLRAAGYAALAREAASIANTRAVPAAALEPPFPGREHNLAVGLNYREHARESSLEEEPFLFPKFAAPGRFDAPVAHRAGMRLDYEAEVGLVALQDLTAGLRPATLGLVLANELTDRWALVRHIDLDAPMGTTGFADGKSAADFAPVGPLLVVPRDLDGFLASIELQLYVNGRLRQQAPAADMVWDARRVLAEAFWRADWRFAYRGGTVGLLPEPGRIPAGTVLFSGTPAGVIFRPVNVWNPWVYLRPGDEIVLRADFLGIIRNGVVAGP